MIFIVYKNLVCYFYFEDVCLSKCNVCYNLDSNAKLAKFRNIFHPTLDKTQKNHLFSTQTHLQFHS